MAIQPAPRVLSIQSHVVSGYVGNKVAPFALQLLGYDVDVLNTVQFSNHLGYGHHGGDKMSPDHLLSCIQALHHNGLLNHRALLTGFTPGPEGLDFLKQCFTMLKKNNPDLVFLVDPVMGDDGKLYVSDQVPPRYKDLLQLATIATPNEFEAHVLTGLPITSIAQICDCLADFHTSYGLQHVVITSISISRSQFNLAPLPEADHERNVLVCAGSTKADKPEPWIIIFPKRQGRYDGFGDLFASVLLGHLLSSASMTLAKAAELALNTTQMVLDNPRSPILIPATVSPQALRAHSAEMNIIQSRSAIEKPQVTFKAIPVSLIDSRQCTIDELAIYAGSNLCTYNSMQFAECELSWYHLGDPQRAR
ncbi:hypothetical protein O181_082638 [Austropuccinia psidii MF-1]|uniref:pyridoxal kinase n=1 Tax=Austropuccinia psidii MF-1 TaxID=1389203 RepID=A0A9Q3FS60_9BASI|nr:hypothetical protein [Austropuccinia psidii MF-1]